MKVAIVNASARENGNSSHAAIFIRRSFPAGQMQLWPE